jgi:hypothetical protein
LAQRLHYVAVGFGISLEIGGDDAGDLMDDYNSNFD